MNIIDDNRQVRGVGDRVKAQKAIESGMEASMREIKEKMESSEPGIRVLDLAMTGGDRVVYLIATPHVFPRFVVGMTDRALSDIRIIVGCGEEWSARARFEEAA